MTSTARVRASGHAKPEGRQFSEKRNWLERWWSPDPRLMPRKSWCGITAYCWNGGAPLAQSIRDISGTGLYLTTDERWHQDTLVLMTLQTSNDKQDVGERSISVVTRVVRSSCDGIGMRFVFSDSKEDGFSSDCVGRTVRRAFKRFLEQSKESI